MSKSPMPTLEQNKKAGGASALQCTVTGVDSNGQLFRDSASIVFLKGQKCIYISKFKPSPDGSVMIELRGGKEAWRSTAKIRGASTAAERGSFRVTVELEHAHSIVIEDVEEPAAEITPVNTLAGKLPSAPVVSTKSTGKPGTPAVNRETTTTDPGAAADATSQASAKGGNNPAEFALSSADSPIKPVAVPTSMPVFTPSVAAKTMVADAVRAAMASELEQWKSELQSAVAGQVAAAMKKPLDTIEVKIAQQAQRPAALTEESVRKIAAQAAENAQIEWAMTSQQIVGEAVRSAVASENDQQRREMSALVSGEIEAALRGPLGARVDSKVDKTVDAKIEEHSRRRPSITEDTVRRLATQVAEGVQLEWVSTKLQKMVTEAVRSAQATDSGQRRAEIASMVSDEIDAAVQGPLSARIDAVIENALGRKIEQHLQKPEVLDAFQALIANAVRPPLEAEYELRGRQVQAAVSAEIEAAVRGPIADQMDEMLRKALERQREDYLRTPPPVTEEHIRLIAASVADHPQFQSSMDALAANLTDRWTEVARGATAAAQQDINSRVAATERLTNQVVLEIQQKLNSFGVEMNRILGTREMASSSDGSSQLEEQPESEKGFRDLIQSTGSHFEREMKAALQKIFGKS